MKSIVLVSVVYMKSLRKTKPTVVVNRDCKLLNYVAHTLHSRYSLENLYIYTPLFIPNYFIFILSPSTHMQDIPKSK